MSANSPQSVTHVIWSGSVGGIERLVCDLAAQQVREGLAVTVAFGSAEGPFVEAARDGGAHIVELGFKRGFASSRGRIVDAARHLAASEVVHLHGYCFVLAAAARKSARPVVFTEHGNFGHAREPTMAGRVKAWRKARFLPRMNAIAANSEFTASRLCDLYAIDRRKVAVVYNGVAPANHYGPLPVEVSATNTLRVAFVGRLVDWKRPGLLIEGLARVVGRERVSVEIVGNGPLQGELRAQVEASGVRDSVAFLGYQSDVFSILAATDVLVHPSRDEPFGLAIVEAALAGALPIVFADGGGAIEAIPPDGIVVGGPAELADVLAVLIGSPALSADARARRASWARERFAISRTSREYCELYRVAMGNNG